MEASDARYRPLLQAMAVSLWELECIGLEAVFDDLRAHQVTDLRTHIATHPAFVDLALEAVRIVDVNERSIEWFGASKREELLGSVRRFWPPASRGAFAEALMACFSCDVDRDEKLRGVPGYQGETRLLTLQGDEVDVQFTLTWPTDDVPSTTLLVGMIDIADRKRLEKVRLSQQTEFTRAARTSMLGELTASIAQAITQPISAIANDARASLGWLDRSPPEVRQATQLLHRVVADTHRTMDVMSRVRQMSLSQAPDRIVVFLQEIIQDAAAFLSHEIQNHQVKLRLDLHPDLPPVEADRVQMHQVIVNLSINAMQAMAEQGEGDHHLALCAHSLGDLVQVDVEDNGPGVAPEDMNRLFESFFTTRTDGLGMGLAICRSIVEAHQGTIWFEPVPGRGSRFCFTLPAA
ncbi:MULTISPECIES: sensor histidine kinase [Dyella]|uniref:histidine kinase n=2 Tax=Dyella TaxID=231454 RepID=A0A4R0YZP2_9GAMM|nr:MULTISPECIES: ATP-binding protein [Dyella]TBR39505.1 hypothetical protein EYV96_04645 [Dyella terrae]TCI12909.1 hypothetical protein EZM97_06225 [Dyella soli]